MAPQNSVKSTAIALVKIESSFLHGSTIAATSWIAYAMTKGKKNKRVGSDTFTLTYEFVQVVCG